MAYVSMEPTLLDINSHYISISDEEVARNNRILQIIHILIDDIRIMSPLFNSLFQEIYFGGSYYDGMKVGHPDEYDIDLLLRLPKCDYCRYSCSCLTLNTSNKPGYVNMKVDKNNENRFLTTPNFITDGYLDTDKVRNWMRGLVHKALNNRTIIPTIDGDFMINSNYRTFGPAITLTITEIAEPHSKIIMDIDLVPCFVLNTWPSNGFVANPTYEDDVFIVPKPITDAYMTSYRYWRLSFQKQERILMNGLNRAKPTVRLLKKLRESMGHTNQVASYYIKTIVLWEIKERGPSFWNKPLSEVFMCMLKKYLEHLDNRRIPYYWYRKNRCNLLTANESTLINMANQLRRAINNIERDYATDPLVVARYILTPGEYEDYKSQESLVEAVETSRCIIL